MPAQLVKRTTCYGEAFYTVECQECRMMASGGQIYAEAERDGAEWVGQLHNTLTHVQVTS